MNEQEAAQQTLRINKFKELERARDNAYCALAKITEDWKETGPCGQGPFTGNTRESRRITGMSIRFSTTRGGSSPVEIVIADMEIEAHEVGQMLALMLERKIMVLSAEIDQI